MGAAVLICAGALAWLLLRGDRAGPTWVDPMQGAGSAGALPTSVEGERASGRLASGEPGEVVPHLAVVWVVSIGGDALANTQWELTAVSASGDSMTVDTDPLGRMQAPAGTWRVSSLPDRSRWIPTEVEYSFDERVEETVWMREAGELAVRVIGPGGVPVPDARLACRSADEDLPASGASARDVATREIRTDATGRATVAVPQGFPSVLLAVHEGYDASSIPIVRRPHGEITVHLSPSSSAHELLKIVDGSTLLALEGSTASDGLGSFPGNSDSAGLLAVPSWHRSGDAILVRAARYCEQQVFLGAGPGPTQVALSSATRLHVQITSGTGAPAGPVQLIARQVLDDPSGERRSPPRTASATASPVGECTLMLPTGEMFEVSAVSAQDGSAVATVATIPGDQSLSLAMDGTDSLSLTCEDETGSRIEGIRVEVAYLPPSRHLILEGDEVRVGRAGLVESLWVSSPGSERIELTPDRGVPDRGGRLLLRPRKSVRAECEVRDPSGKGIQGMRVVLDGPVELGALSRSPDRSGFIPTDHPGWRIRARSLDMGTTNPLGVACFPDVAVGDYEISIRLPEHECDLAPGAEPILPSTRAWIDGSRRLALVAERPSPLVVTALDAVTESPLREVSIQADETGRALNDPPSGNSHLVWIARSGLRLRIHSPNYEPLLHEVAESELESGTLVVSLVPGTTGSVCLEGDTAILAGQGVDVLAWSDSASRARGDPPAWRGHLGLGSSRMAISIPMDRGYVELGEWIGERAFVRFEPLVNQWQSGAELRFKAVRVR